LLSVVARKRSHEERKRSIIRVNGVVDKEEYNQFDEPNMHDDGDGSLAPCLFIRKIIILTTHIELPYKRSNHN
jgi:hypothetical protein